MSIHFWISMAFGICAGFAASRQLWNWAVFFAIMGIANLLIGALL